MNTRFWIGVSFGCCLISLCMIGMSIAHAQCTTTQVSASHRSISCGDVGPVVHAPRVITTAVVAQYSGSNVTPYYTSGTYPVRAVQPVPGVQVYGGNNGQYYTASVGVVYGSQVGVQTYGPSRGQLPGSVHSRGRH